MAKIIMVGGLSTSLINFRGKLIEEFKRNGHDVIACAGGDDIFVKKWMEERGVEYYELPINRTGINPVADLLLFLKLIKLCRDIRPQYILAYTIKPVVYGVLSARISGVPYRYAMITGLGSTFLPASTVKQCLSKMFVPLFYKVALAQSTKVIFQNKDDLMEFEKRLLLNSQTKSEVINGSGVDIEHFNVMPLPKEEIIFLMVARLLKDKGVYEYVEAAKIIAGKHANIRFKLLGTFDSNPSAISKKEVELWIKEGVIEYLGETHDVRPVFEASTVYVLPSYREGIPRTVLEAMAIGRPVITTNVPGCKETVIDGENGYLVPVRDAKVLSEVMERFIVDPSLANKMGSIGRKMVEYKYNVTNVNQAILKIMQL